MILMEKCRGIILLLAVAAVTYLVTFIIIEIDDSAGCPQFLDQEFHKYVNRDNVNPPDEIGSTFYSF